MIKILKASAGSGKTWNLARYYLKLLLEKNDPFSYRHILAVTFTNKATDEMKDRILKELDKLSKNPTESDYYNDFVPELYTDANALSEAATQLLCNILHDYSAFSVSTIDRFFQQTLRAFAREIGHFSSYAVELDKASLIKESVDRLLDSLTDTAEHSRALEWMTRKTLAQLEEGEGYKLDYTLKKIADRFNSEEFKMAVKEAGIDESALYSEQNLNKLDSGCDEICNAYIKTLSEAVTLINNCFTAAGLKPEDTYSSFMSKNLSKYAFLTKDKSVPLPSDAFRRRALDSSEWFSKTKKYLEDSITPELLAAVSAFFSLFDRDYKVYNTAMQLKKQVYGFAVANDLYETYKEIMKEKNVLTIDQTNNLLRDIIDGSDTPFVYEKIGVRYDHFLLDEFQDTSSVQWENFKPLLDNSVGEGCRNLIVGDVKQSIYRWRQSDWELLENQVQNDFKGYVDIEPLDKNFRSAPEIVNFNNEYFTSAAEYLDTRLENKEPLIRAIYSDVRQKVHKKLQGMVEVSYCCEEDLYLSILEHIREAVRNSYKLGEITILVRLNKEGAEIADYLLENGIPVVSDDSLKVSSSLTVRRLVSLLAGIENPEDNMSRHLAESLGIEVPDNWLSLVDLCEDLLRKLELSDSVTYHSETLYIQSFMDIVLDFVSSEGNSLRAFLKKWAEDKTNISSPKSEDSVRIMTVHKSKGLDFPYVIFPSMASVEFYSFDNKWSRPAVEGTALEDIAAGVYDVYLSGKSKDTLFEQSYKEELLMQYIDNINVMYVAMTRASRAMTVISPMPKGIELTEDGYLADEKSFSGFSQWTMTYLLSKYKELGFEKFESEEKDELCFIKGSLEAPLHEAAEEVESLHSHFCSWPQKGRLRFSADAKDFFSNDGNTGLSASNRIRGVVLHDILSQVIEVGDLENAVIKARLSGHLSDVEADEAYKLLSQRISEVEARGWFPKDRYSVLNETSLIDSDGREYRPDRVIRTPEKIMIVDYKFGEEDRRYLKQIQKYAEMWRRMGYENVSAALWYVQSGDIVEL